MLKSILVLAAAVSVTGATLRHAGLKSSIPAKNAMLTASPKSISLTFTEGVLVPVTTISVLKADSTLVQKLDVKAIAGDTTVAGDLAKALLNGTYIVKWHNAAKDDGHTLSGAFSFMVMTK